MKEEENHKLEGHYGRGNSMCKGMGMRNSFVHLVNKCFDMTGAQWPVSGVGQRRQRDV